MLNKWMSLLMVATMTAVPLYRFLSDERLGALLIGAPSFLIGVALNKTAVSR